MRKLIETGDMVVVVVVVAGVGVVVVVVVGVVVVVVVMYDSGFGGPCKSNEHWGRPTNQRASVRC